MELRQDGQTRQCFNCGCTFTTPCIDEHGHSCSWVEAELCSACAGPAFGAGQVAFFYGLSRDLNPYALMSERLGETGGPKPNCGEHHYPTWDEQKEHWSGESSCSYGCGCTLKWDVHGGWVEAPGTLNAFAECPASPWKESNAPFFAWAAQWNQGYEYQKHMHEVESVEGRRSVLSGSVQVAI